MRSRKFDAALRARSEGLLPTGGSHGARGVVNGGESHWGRAQRPQWEAGDTHSSSVVRRDELRGAAAERSEVERSERTAGSPGEERPAGVGASQAATLLRRSTPASRQQESPQEQANARMPV